MTNLAHPPTWFATLLLVPLWLTGLVLVAGLSALLVVVRRWRTVARGRALDSQPALWPADTPTYRRPFAVLSAEFARVRRIRRASAVLVVAPASGVGSGPARAAGRSRGGGN